MVSLCFAQQNSLIDWALGLDLEEHLFKFLNLKIREFGYILEEGGRAPTWKQLFQGGACTIKEKRIECPASER